MVRRRSAADGGLRSRLRVRPAIAFAGVFFVLVTPTSSSPMNPNQPGGATGFFRIEERANRQEVEGEPPINLAPVANAGLDQEITLPASASLEGKRGTTACRTLQAPSRRGGRW